MGGALEQFTLVPGVLALECEPDLVPLLLKWLPRHEISSRRSEPSPSSPLSSRRSERSERVSGSASLITVREADTRPFTKPTAPRTLSLSGCDAWIEGNVVTLASTTGDVHGTMRLDQRQAELNVSGAPTSLDGALTISAALLLGRAHHALVHCGAIVSPDNQGWLVVGDAHSGKSTLTAGAIVGGWRYAADDQCVLHGDADGTVMAEGWPRDFHLDEGWSSGKPSGVRRTITPDTDLAAGRWQRSASVGGIVMPSIARELPTQLVPSTASTALAALIRQSPWLAADSGAAREIMSMLERVSSLPCFSLRMGLDSYADRTILTRLLDDLGTHGSALIPS